MYAFLGCTRACGCDVNGICIGQRSQPTRGRTVWQQQMPAHRDQLLSSQSAVYFDGFPASSQFEATELTRYMITTPQRRQPDHTHLKLLQMSGDVHPNPGPATKYPCPVCTRNVTCRGVSYRCTRYSRWVHTKCSGILNAAQYRRKCDLTCDTCSAPPSQQSPPPTRSPAPPTEQISYDSTFNVLQLNVNGIGNKLAELGVVLDINKVKLALIISRAPSVMVLYIDRYNRKKNSRLNQRI